MLTFAGYTMDPNYIPPMRVSQPTSTSGASAYTPALPSSPSLYQSRTYPETTSSRRHSEMPSSSGDQGYGQSYRRISNPYDSSSSSEYSMASSSQTIPSISGLTQSPLPSPHLSSTPGARAGAIHSYHSNSSRSVAHSICRHYCSADCPQITRLI